ncbi:hypothetical protein [Nitrospirillum sp. BR 11828]|uniref:hypothetical protein n=1 Tax=Nitrospirillum sp. BR 11828 TaxID=3104325 RepID=UPI002ACA971A|nr:hypothetical protein [Nitrospirillum sp. BR 11828]MDZ5650755.1 hypothetical protein [Nitrospirillum sp. BR 11828]
MKSEHIVRLVLLVIAVGLVILLVFLGHFPIWLAVMMALAALAVNGWLLAWEDELPGGFNNPHPPKARLPPSRRPWSR